MKPWYQLSDSEVPSGLRQRFSSPGQPDLERAFSYPYQGMPFSYLLTGQGIFTFLSYNQEDLGGSEILCHRRSIAARTVLGEDSPRTPVLAYGANGNPAVLSARLQGAAVPVLAGQLVDFEIGFSPHFSSYGALPATIFPSPGSQVRSYLLLLTEPQFAALADAEVNYLLASIPGDKFTAAGFSGPENILAFVSRRGLLAIYDRPRALAAVPARRRHHPVWSERQALSAVSSLLALPGPEALVEKAVTDYSWALDQIETLSEHARHNLLETGATPVFS